MQGAFGCSNSQLQRTDVGPETKKQRNKRAQRTGEKAAPRSKKRKKEEEEKQAVYPNADTFIQLKQVRAGAGKSSPDDTRSSGLLQKEVKLIIKLHFEHKVGTMRTSTKSGNLKFGVCLISEGGLVWQVVPKPWSSCQLWQPLDELAGSWS